MAVGNTLLSVMEDKQRLRDLLMKIVTEVCDKEVTRI